MQLKIIGKLMEIMVMVIIIEKMRTKTKILIN